MTKMASSPEGCIFIFCMNSPTQNLTARKFCHSDVTKLIIKLISRLR